MSVQDDKLPFISTVGKNLIINYLQKYREVLQDLQIDQFSTGSSSLLATRAHGKTH